MSVRPTEKLKPDTSASCLITNCITNWLRSAPFPLPPVVPMPSHSANFRQDISASRLATLHRTCLSCERYFTPGGRSPNSNQRHQDSIHISTEALDVGDFLQLRRTGGSPYHHASPADFLIIRSASGRLWLSQCAICQAVGHSHEAYSS